MNNEADAMVNKTKRAVLAAVLLSACAAVVGVAQGQAPIEGATLVSGGVDPGQYLANVYKDEASGFRIAPPVGSRIIRKQGRDLMAFVVDSKSWGGNLQLVTMDRPGTIDEYVKSVQGELAKSFKGVQVLDSSKTQTNGRAGCRLTTSMEAEVGQAAAPGKAPPPNVKVEMITLLRQQMILQMKPNQFMVLSMWAPLRDRTEAQATFEAMLDTFEVFNADEMRARRAKAILLGKEWLSTREAEELKPRLSNQPQMFRMIVGGKDVGYLRFDEKESVNDQHKGVELNVNFRSFPDDGSVVYGKNVAFWGESKDASGEKLPHYSMWDNTSKIIAKLPGQSESSTFWRNEIGSLNQEGNLRFTDEELKKMEEERQKLIARDPRNPPPAIPRSEKKYRIIVTLDGDKSQSFRIPSPDGKSRNSMNMLLPSNAPAPLPKILEYTWTRLVDLAKPTEMSFWVFDSSTQTLAVRTLIVTGKKERVTVNGKAQDCFRCIDELDPGSTTLWVDSDGRIVTMRTSDQTVLLPTSEQEMQAKWSSRLGQQ